LIDYTALGASMPACFERAARLYPDRIAVHCRLGAITYAELNHAADRLARRIIASGRLLGDRVAILMPQDRRSFIAMLAALKAGCVVVVLNGQDPPARIAQLLDDAEPTLILTIDQRLAQAKEIAGTRLAIIDVDAVKDVAAETPTAARGPDDIAFLVYTSGSTGRPRGVMQTHGQVLRSALDVGRALGIKLDDRVLLVASLWGGQAVTATWLALIHGASLLSFPAVENGVTGLAAWMIEKRASIFVSASSLFRHFMRTVDAGTSFPDVRWVRLSADPATREDFGEVLAHFPNAKLMHAMGMSEVSHLASMIFARDAIVGEGRLPVGRPADGVDLRIIDAEGRECPAGTIGKLSLRLPYLAAGYWRDPELTAKHFFRDPDGVRGFRSEDLASIDARGMIVLAGRNDATHKIRGQRVDIAEVESDLASIDSISELAVVAVARPNGEPALVAYVVPAAGLVPSASRLRTAARTFMPRHLIPSMFVFVDALPRTANGKVDRAALRDQAPALVQDGVGGPPETDTEAIMTRIWAQAFDLDGIGRRDDFFELGGDSLIGTVIAALLHEAKRANLDFGAFVHHPVLKDLAAFVDSSGLPQADDDIPRARTNRRRPAPISMIQRYHWERKPRSRHTRAAYWLIEGPLDTELLRSSLSDVVARHEILRTRFDFPPQRFKRLRQVLRLKAERMPRQRVQPPSDVPLPFVDLSDVSDAETRFDALASEARATQFDLTAGPPLAFTLIRLGPDRHALLQSSHHIISDGPSWNVFARDLAHCYEARLHEREPSLPPLDIQYADYARWEQEQWQPGGAKLEAAVEWWARQFKDLPPPPASGWLGAYKWQGTPAETSAADGSISWGLDALTSERLDRQGTALNATYLAVRWATLLPVFAMAAGHDRVVIGTNRTNRTRIELQQMFGPLFGGLALPMRCDWQSSFRDLVCRAQHKLVEMPAAAALPEHALIAELKARGIAVSPPVLRIRTPPAIPPVHFGELKMTRIRIHPHLHSAITLSYDRLHEQAGCLVEFNRRVYSQRLVREFLDHLIVFTRNAASDPTASIEALIEADGIGAALRARNASVPR
jgi:amino acid adenylation domain-containing protein